MVVDGVVCFGAVDVGNRAGKGIGGAVVRGRMDIRNNFLFRHVLVADICPDHLRGIPLAARIFSNPYCYTWCRSISGDLRGDNFDISTAVWFLGFPSRPVRLGIHRISAVLADGE